MTEVTQGILANANKGRYSSIKDALSEDDVSSVWENVSNYIEKQMTQQKGVQIPGLGTFSISQKKLEIGNNRFILTQRPVFNISEKFAQTHGLQFQKYHVPGSIPVLPLNFASISFESPFDRDTVERCCKEIISSSARALASKRNIELCFSGIGRLTIREGRVKMKFYKEFINEMDSSGKLVDSMMNRVGTVDSVMSDRLSVRPHSSNTMILPKISSGRDGSVNGLHNSSLTPVVEQEEDPAGAEFAGVPGPPGPVEVHFYPEVDEPGYGAGGAAFAPQPEDLALKQEGMEGPDGDFATDHAMENILREGDTANADSQPSLVPQPFEMDVGNQNGEAKIQGSRAGSRMALPMAKANGISLTDELNVLPTGRMSRLSAGAAMRMSHGGEGMTGLKPPTPPRLAPLHRSRSLENLQNDPNAPMKVPTPPASACGHPSAGQELCYLCHQRARMNVPVSFTEERKRREEEEDHLLQQYQTMKDAEETLKDQERYYSRRHDLQKISAFNLGVSEAVQAKKKMKDTEPQRAYIFNKRPLTPSRMPKQEEYLKDLDKQVVAKETAKQRKKTDEEFLERLEQVQLAEDLAAQREQYLRDKVDSTETYKKALEAQLRFKPIPMPEREPDYEVFGKNDMTNEKMAERRRRAFNLFSEQQALVEQRKRDTILSRLAEQQKEEQVLDRAKKDLVDERTFKHVVRFDTRRRLETDWQRMAETKRARELEDRLRSLSPGILLHEQCDRYNRCRQCKRRVHNCGETNIWSESRYIPGSRIMV
ncbi:coiled-coil domain-containing protein 81 [Aplysia californica]|uniref:Coiled-coil domain-containing protein 81 n=1 Tax=Aplysia californica TaxID=6500 RepID=A0ABM0JWE1_APLCA|nr:coiled-coil domain-containing protein 81 [Aplysia californica]